METNMLRQLKDLMRKWKDSSDLGEKVFNTIRSAVLSFSGFVPDEPYARMFYKIYTGKDLNLEDPVYFNEKLWWLKLHNRNPLLTTCSDKHLVREYVKECGLSDILIPQVEVLKNAEQIDFSRYNYPVILKCNKDSGGHVLYDPDSRESFDEKAARTKLKKALAEKYYLISREWNYKNISPRIVVEKVIKDKEGNLPGDYRFFCFDGIPRLLMMDFGVLTDQGRHKFAYPRNIYDMDFNLLPVRIGRDNYRGKVEKPENLDRMIQIAARLSQPFPVVRVDLYNVDGVIYFGEMTFYHGGCCQEITPEEWDLKMGSWIDLTSKKIVLNPEEHCARQIRWEIRRSEKNRKSGRCGKSRKCRNNGK